MVRLKEGFQPMDQPVVVLTDLSHCYQGLEVLIGLVGVDVVQGGGLSRVPIGRSEVNPNLSVNRYNYIVYSLYIVCERECVCVCVCACVYTHSKHQLTSSENIIQECIISYNLKKCQGILKTHILLKYHTT